MARQRGPRPETIRTGRRGVVGTKKLRLALFLRDGGCCMKCGKSMLDADPKDVTFDHIQPWSQGGADTAENLVLNCRSCNSARGTKPFEEWYAGGPLERVRIHVRRPMDRYTKLAHGFLLGKTGDPRAELRA